MADDIFKAPKAKRKNDFHAWSSEKKRRTKEDFFTFCNIVLAYTNYEASRQEEMRSVNNSSPLGSVGSSVDSYSSESSLSSMSPSSSYCGFSDDVPSSGRLVPNSDDEEGLITCFCMKPYGGRPMIECSSCLTWVHLSCAKIRKSNIPDTYVCQKCKDAQANPRKSNRPRTEKRRDSS